MTSKTSILLIISQNPGIDYQAVLAKIAPNYANLNSARAALSRVLKDAVSFGMLQKKDHQLFLTDKGAAGLKVKMHDKLVLKLNQLMKVRSVASNPDALVQHLSVLLERGKMDPRLLDNARASVSFSVNDLTNVHAGLQENIRHLQYLEKTLSTQLHSLREFNFPSSHAKRVSEMLPHIPALVRLSSADEVQLEHTQMDLTQNLSHPLLAGLSANPKGSRVAMPSHRLSELVSRLPNQEPTFGGLKAYLGLFSLDLGREHVTVRAPAQMLEKVFPHSETENAELVSIAKKESGPLVPAHPLKPLPVFPWQTEDDKPPLEPRESDE